MPTPKSANWQKNHDHSRSTKKHTSGAGISGAEIWSTPPYPVSPSERERLPPLPEYVRAEPTYVGWRNFCRLGNGIPPREGRQNVWGEAEQGYIQPNDAISVEHSHGVLGREGLATAEENYRRTNARSSKFIVTMKNATEKAILRGERVAALKAGEKKASPADRSTVSLPHPSIHSLISLSSTNNTSFSGAPTKLSTRLLTR